MRTPSPNKSTVNTLPSIHKTKSALHNNNKTPSLQSTKRSQSSKSKRGSLPKVEQIIKPTDYRVEVSSIRRDSSIINSKLKWNPMKKNKNTIPKRNDTFNKLWVLPVESNMNDTNEENAGAVPTESNFDNIKENENEKEKQTEEVKENGTEKAKEKENEKGRKVTKDVDDNKSVKFVSMSSYNIARWSWSKEQGDTSINKKIVSAKKKWRKKSGKSDSKNKSKRKDGKDINNDNTKENGGVGQHFSHFSDVRFDKKGKARNTNYAFYHNNKLKSIELSTPKNSKSKYGNSVNRSSQWITWKKKLKLESTKDIKDKKSMDARNNKSRINSPLMGGVRKNNSNNNSNNNKNTWLTDTHKVLSMFNKNNPIENKTIRETQIPKSPKGAINNSFTFGPNKEPNRRAHDNNDELLPNNEANTSFENINLINNQTWKHSPISSHYPKRKSIIFQEVSNVSNINIQSVTWTNLKLTREIQDSLSELIDTSSCVYCLKRVNYPITLSCLHEICLACAEESLSLDKFSHNNITIHPNTLKCPKCKSKTIFKSSWNSLLRLNWKPTDPAILNEKEKIQLCEICPSNKYIHDIAEYECLNCDIVMCYECRIRHWGNLRHQDHKIIQYHKIVQEKAEWTLCEENNHREPLKLFCESCSRPICLMCAQYESNHKAHSIKTVKNVWEEQSVLLSGSLRKNEGQIKIIKELISHMSYSKSKLEGEKKKFIETMNTIFNNIDEIIRKHRSSWEEYIDKLFASKLDTLTIKLTNLVFVKGRYEYYRNWICDRDIDIIDRVKQMDKLNKTISKIENLGWLKLENFNKSLTHSLFINEPTKQLSKLVSQFKFLPITDINIKIWTTLFKTSTIIQPEMWMNSFIVILPKIKSGVLLYQISKDGVSPITFHEKCDNKGPTITIVKTDSGHIFGAFNPISWISEAMYNETEESFIFSLSNGMEINPIKCPVIKYMKHHAIKQNDKQYSPGFGEIDSADLFISFINLNHSYSNLGRVYKAPKGVEGDKLWAGSPNKWNIIEVEIYAVEVLQEDEYYNMVLT